MVESGTSLYDCRGCATDRSIYAINCGFVRSYTDPISERITPTKELSMKRFALSLLLLASLPAFALDKAATPAAAGVQKYTIDNGHTVVTFGWNHFGFSNPTARLEKIDGVVLLDAADLTKSSVTVTLPLDGLHTGVEKLDAHLKTDEFLDAAKYPAITFKSTKVEKNGSDSLK